MLLFPVMGNGWRRGVTVGVGVLLLAACGKTARDAATEALPEGGVTARATGGGASGGSPDAANGGEPRGGVPAGGSGDGATSAGGAATGGAPTGGMPAGGTVTGGVAAGAAPTGGGGNAGGAGSIGGSARAGAGAAGAGGAGAVTASAGAVAAGADGGGAGSVYLDALGDAPDPGSDLLEAHLYAEAGELVFQLRFASDPLTGTETRVAFHLPRGPADTVRAELSVERRGDGFSVQWPSLSLGFDPCLVTTVEAASGWLEIRLPAWVAAGNSLESGFSVEVGFEVDQLDAGTVPVEPGPAPSVGGDPACAPWSEPDNPRNHVYRSAEQYQDIAVEHDFGCGVTLDGEVTCWGTSYALDRLGAPPAGVFVDVAVADRLNDDAACARTAEGEAVCWGFAPPVLSGSYAELGDEVGCVLTAAKDAYCPAVGPTPELVWPGPFEQVGGTAIEVCGLKPDDGIVCSGVTPAPDPEEVDLHGGYVSILVSSDDGVCGLHQDAWLSCPAEPEFPYAFQNVDGLAAWRGNVGPYCAVILDGYPFCWGRGGVTPYVPAGPFERIHVSSSGTVICGFHLDRTVSCWINPNNMWEAAAASLP